MIGNLSTCDFLIVGGGFIGLRLAIEAKQRHPKASVVLLEKEAHLGEHASGRNSGVLHAGFYYTADSLKARFTRDGCRQVTEYCIERGLQINRCGKLVVTRGPAEAEALDELFRRAAANGVQVEKVTEKEAKEIEPRVRTWERALYSPNTASIDPAELIASFADEARGAGVELITGTQFLDSRNGEVHTTAGAISAGYVINAAGLYADQVARTYGFAERYRILPFKGLYLYGGPGAGAFRTNIYPVPVLSQPFLGVHFTTTVEGNVKIGPTAIPALWREQYGGTANFKWAELREILGAELGLFASNTADFRSLAVTELKKYWRRTLVRQAAELATGIRQQDWKSRGRVGIRAQLLDTVEKKLEMDFRVELDDRSCHVLNAVSPGLTCSIPFSQYTFDQIEKARGASD
ncbi:L-2-hydroxyglutarate oxidase [soil metagenome]